MGAWGSPQIAFGYPNAMLAVPVLAFSPYFSQQILFNLASLTFHRFVLNHPVQCRADDINPVVHADFCIHNSDHFRKIKIYQFIEFAFSSSISQFFLYHKTSLPFLDIHMGIVFDFE